MTWGPRPPEIRIGARRLALKSDSSEPARTVTRTSTSSAELAGVLAGLALGQEVPEELWAAVAEALAWAYSVSGAAITPNR